MPTLNRTIVRPIVTEKSSAAFQERQEYTFEVHPLANKTEIRAAIESLFGVKVTGVWTSQQRGKPRRLGAGKAGLRPRWKKAIVTLKEGDTIEIFEG
jgi:large subunit ribosomal protein L23